MSIQTKESYLEVYIILTKLDLFSELPENIQNMIKSNMSDEHNFDFNEHIPLHDQIENEETLSLISYLYLKYLCNDEKEKQYLLSKYKDNENKFQEELREKYNPDDLFKNKKNNTQIREAEVCMVKYKESIFKKFLNKLKNIFKK